MYRYTIDLTTKEIRMFTEKYNFKKGVFMRGKEITDRYDTYVESIRNKERRD